MIPQVPRGTFEELTPLPNGYVRIRIRVSQGYYVLSLPQADLPAFVYRNKLKPPKGLVAVKLLRYIL